MRIAFLRTGGFAGLRLALELDTESMDARDASEITELVQAAGFYKLPARLPSTAQARDRFQYRLRVSTSTRHEHEVVVDEDSIPGELMPLVIRLTVLALQGGPEEARS
jgi:hypothetical protein